MTINFANKRYLIVSIYLNKSYINNNLSPDESIEYFKRNLTNLIDIVKILTPDNSNSFFADTSNIKTNNNNNNYFNKMSNIYWMLQDPIDEKKSLANKSASASASGGGAERTATNTQIDLYNRMSINYLYEDEFLFALSIECIIS